MKTSLRGKVAIVTGGGTGIGRGVAQAIAAEGAKVVVCGRRLEPLQDTARTIQAQGNQCLALQADISSDRDVQHLIETSYKHYDRIDILVNNAGIFADAPVHSLDPSEWDRIMATNLRGPYLMTRYALPYMRSQSYGHIINISSESGLEYYQNDAAYGTSKHALNSFGEYTQRENQEFNIRVNTICPGMVVTEMTDNSTGLDHSKCLYPEDIADLVLWLLTRRQNIKIGTPILIQTMINPWA
jgi:3-oxoacyl-[acyl-carrier protein] reductase